MPLREKHSKKALDRLARIFLHAGKHILLAVIRSGVGVQENAVAGIDRVFQETVPREVELVNLCRGSRGWERARSNALEERGSVHYVNVITRSGHQKKATISTSYRRTKPPNAA
jgi:hypothetical protein